MPNRHRGEIEAVFDNVPHTLCLTLGALTELEAAFGDGDMLALAERFQTGRLSARDATRILGAGLRGAGHVINDDRVAQMKTDNGAAGFVAVVAQLLAATFGGPAGAAIASAAVSAVVAALPRASADETIERPPLPLHGPPLPLHGPPLPLHGPPLPLHGPPLPFHGPM
jgi:Phage tail tube protein, GTA-gp10